MFYILAVIFLIRQKWSLKITSHFEKNEFRNQFRIFITVSLLLLVYFLTYGIPTILNIIGIVYEFGPGIKTYSGVYAGVGSLISAMLDIILYLFRHHEIKNCALIVSAKIFPCLRKKVTPASGAWMVIRSLS